MNSVKTIFAVVFGALVLTSIKRKNTDELFWIGLSIGLILFVTILNYKEIWITVRFSRLLVIPLLLSIAIWKNHIFQLLNNISACAILVVLFGDINLFFLYYKKSFF